MSLAWRPEAGSPAVPGGPVAVAPARIGCPQGAPSQGQDPGKVILVGVDGSVSGRTTLGAAALVVATGARHRHWHSCPARRDAARSDRPAIIASATPTVDATPKERR
jgi:hypothetical protein